MAASRFTATFWGVRGSIPTSGPEIAEFGGESSCVEVRCGGRSIIFDGGSGIRRLGLDLKERGVARTDILLTHLHYDHIIGLPFFKPFVTAGSEIDIWAGPNDNGMVLDESLRSFMRAPFFPICPDIFSARVTPHDFKADARLDLGDGIVIDSAPLNHPDGCNGYRLEFDGRVLAYVTDTEHDPGKSDTNVLRLIEKADVVIYDSTYTDEEMKEFSGFGHSTWQEGVRLCKEAGAKRLIGFHHRPTRTDTMLHAMERALQAALPGSRFARQGSTITL